MSTVTSPGIAIADAAGGPTTASGASSTGRASARLADPAEQQDRFLKLLVTQLKNQDPMNPMDNAQMTSQIAQINTVTGIQQLNETVKGITAQFSAMQLVQGAQLVGREVLLQGDALTIDESGAQGSFDLAADASNVRIEALSAGGRVVASRELGALGAGRHEASFAPGSLASALGGAGGSGSLRLRVVATSGSEPVAATTYTRDKVTAVSARNGALQLQLGSGRSATTADIQSVL
ncbi:MAG: flagellar hook assembly protein FlgD [Betaproteobacteria bacterium]|nr:flagellar hook assembly protein FlgD [Betaproteobacteria bacterium]NBS47220.1 flagellar hook assembly protein FlgD [Betaproteobacteria bacterium]